MTGESRLDALARDLANGQVSRRTALRRFGAGFAAAALPSFLVADEALARCPPSRKCGSKCCPPGMRCKHGKCKCKGGLTKCGKNCRDLAVDPLNCGACGHVCPAGQTCVSGQCTGGGGGGGGETPQAVCGNGVKETGEACDGADLAGATCQSLGFLSGTLACKADCSGLDTSGCVAAACSSAADCPAGSAGNCQKAACVNGACTSVVDDTDLPVDGNACTDDVCSGGVPSNPPKASGTSCGSGKMCNGSGACVDCVNPSTCPQPTNPYCATAACAGGTCGFLYQPNGTAVTFSCQPPSGPPTTCITCLKANSQRIYCNGSGDIYTSGMCPGGQFCTSFSPPLIVNGAEWGACF
jgi:hypothetical protein